MENLYTLGYVDIRNLRVAIAAHGCKPKCERCTKELEAIDRLDRFEATGADVAFLRELAESAGLPWGELFAGTLELERVRR